MAKWILQHRSSNIITDMTTYHISFTSSYNAFSRGIQSRSEPHFSALLSNFQSFPIWSLSSCPAALVCLCAPGDMLMISHQFVQSFLRKLLKLFFYGCVCSAPACIIGDTSRRSSPQFPVALLHLVCIRKLPGSTQRWAQSMDRRLCLYLDLRLAQRIKEHSH